MKKNKNLHRRGKQSSRRMSKSVSNQSAQVSITKQESSSVSDNQLAQSTDPIPLNQRLIITSGFGGIGKTSLLSALPDGGNQTFLSSMQRISEGKAIALNPYLMYKSMLSSTIGADFFDDEGELLEEVFLKSQKMDLFNSRLEIGRDTLIEKSVEMFKRELELRRKQYHKLHQDEND